MAWGQVPPLLRVEHVTRVFGGLVAVNDVTLEVRAGQIHSIIGPNGAGKTTLFNVVSGELAPTRGRIFLMGREITGLPSYRIARMGLIRTYQITRVFPTLTVRENLEVPVLRRFGKGRPLRTAARRRLSEEVDRVVELVQLEELADRRAGELSHGDQRTLELGMALAARPRLLLVDEPTQGMSPQETWQTVSLLERLRASVEGLAILLIEHDLEVVMELSDHLTVLHRGQVIASGPPDEVQEDPAVQEAYLGVGPSAAT